MEGEFAGGWLKGPSCQPVQVETSKHKSVVEAHRVRRVVRDFGDVASRFVAFGAANHRVGALVLVVMARPANRQQRAVFIHEASRYDDSTRTICCSTPAHMWMSTPADAISASSSERNLEASETHLHAWR